MSNLYDELLNKDKVVLVTHNGRFHSDDVASYAILNKLFPFNEIHRTRDVEMIQNADIVFDVGGGRFDHHMIDKKYRECGLPYASIGLIWEEFGRDFVANVFADYKDVSGIDYGEDEIDYVWKRFDDEFVKPIDAGDNGVDSVEVIVAEPYSVCKIVNKFNVTSLLSNVSEFGRFIEASEFVSNMVLRLMEHLVSDALNLRKFKEVFDRREDSRYVILDEELEWDRVVYEVDVDEELLYVVYPYKSVGEYRIQVVRKNVNTYEARKDLPSHWGGLRDEELANVTGVSDAVFCHTGLFLGVAKSKEGVLKLLEIALGDGKDE